MTQTAERPAPAPLTNPVPGAWIQLSDRDIPPVYVPFEPQYRKNERGKDELTGYAPGAHIHRLLTEGATYANVPGSAVPVVQASGPSTAEMELREQLAQAQEAQDQMFKELAELREHMSKDQNVPNAPKRR